MVAAASCSGATSPPSSSSPRAEALDRRRQALAARRVVQEARRLASDTHHGAEQVLMRCHSRVTRALKAELGSSITCERFCELCAAAVEETSAGHTGASMDLRRGLDADLDEVRSAAEWLFITRLDNGVGVTRLRDAVSLFRLGFAGAYSAEEPRAPPQPGGGGGLFTSTATSAKAAAITSAYDAPVGGARASGGTSLSQSSLTVARRQRGGARRLPSSASSPALDEYRLPSNLLPPPPPGLGGSCEDTSSLRPRPTPAATASSLEQDSSTSSILGLGVVGGSRTHSNGDHDLVPPLRPHTAGSPPPSKLPVNARGHPYSSPIRRAAVPNRQSSSRASPSHRAPRSSPSTPHIQPGASPGGDGERSAGGGAPLSPWSRPTSNGSSRPSSSGITLPPSPSMRALGSNASTPTSIPLASLKRHSIHHGDVAASPFGADAADADGSSAAVLRRIRDEARAASAASRKRSAASPPREMHPSAAAMVTCALEWRGLVGSGGGATGTPSSPALPRSLKASPGARSGHGKSRPASGPPMFGASSLPSSPSASALLHSASSVTPGREQLRRVLSKQAARALTLLRSWSRDADADISRREFIAALRASGCPVAPVVIGSLFDEWDTNHDGSIAMLDLHRILHHKGSLAKAHDVTKLTLPEYIESIASGDYRPITQQEIVAGKVGSELDGEDGKHLQNFAAVVQGARSSFLQAALARAQRPSIRNAASWLMSERLGDATSTAATMLSLRSDSARAANKLVEVLHAKAAAEKGLRGALLHLHRPEEFTRAAAPSPAPEVDDDEEDLLIGPKLFHEGLVELGVVGADDDTSLLFASIDTDKTGSIALTELKAAIAMILDPRADIALETLVTHGQPKLEASIENVRAQLSVHADRVVEAFLRWDVSGDGTLSKGEFIGGMLDELGLQDLNREAIDNLFDAFDIDGSGEISFAEVDRMVHGTRHAPTPTAAAAGAGRVKSALTRGAAHGMEGNSPPASPMTASLMWGEALGLVDLAPLRDEIYKEVAARVELLDMQNEVDRELYGDIMDFGSSSAMGGTATTRLPRAVESESREHAPAAAPASSPARRGGTRRISLENVARADKKFSALRMMMAVRREGAAPPPENV